MKRNLFSAKVTFIYRLFLDTFVLELSLKLVHQLFLHPESLVLRPVSDFSTLEIVSFFVGSPARHSHSSTFRFVFLRAGVGPCATLF